MQNADVLVDPPESFYHAAARASAALPLNATIQKLERDHQALDVLSLALRDMGQTRFINLARSSKQSMVALALYAGDGFVVKIIPTSYLAKTQDVIYHLPAISSRIVESEDNRFAIKTYPWVSQGGVTQFDVEVLRKKINAIGLDFHDKDGLPKNVHRMPDHEGTLVGIDSDMYDAINGKTRITQDLRDAWHAYVHHLFPVYRVGVIPRQTEHTNFSLISVHDKSAEKISFQEEEGEFFSEGRNEEFLPKHPLFEI